MYIIVEHEISNPKTFWENAKSERICVVRLPLAPPLPRGAAGISCQLSVASCL
jgi:hypothetical protein